MTTTPSVPRLAQLSVQNINAHFGSTHVLHDVSFDIFQGQHVAVMGPSGSGKSTLLNCLSGILVPQRGAVIYRSEIPSGDSAEVNTVDVCTLSDRQRSKLRLTDFGFVFQDGQLIPELPARENVALPLRLQGVSRRRALQSADALLDRLGVGEVKNSLPGNVSGGQAQRVATARALAGDKAVLFADEPTGALDQATGYEVMQFLTGYARQRNMTLVVVTHDTNVASWCDRLIEIRDGRLHADRVITGKRTSRSVNLRGEDGEQ